MDVTAHQTNDIDELQRRIRNTTNAKQRDRYRVILLAIRGLTTPQIMDKLDRSRGFVQRWTYVYRDHGLEAIYEQPRSGAPPKLKREDEQTFKDRLNGGPIETDGVCTLRGKNVQRILEEEFGVKYTLDGAYAVLHRLGFSRLRPRPKHRKNDPKKMAQWVNDAPLLSSVRRRNIPTSVLRCGSRMKHALASKVR
ncbi:MAG: transposase [Planctomycetes bacterium]|nr:transposase [Planctomycetota bacterium]